MYNEKCITRKPAERYTPESVFINDLKRTMACIVEWSGDTGSVKFILWNGTHSELESICKKLNRG